MYNIYGTNQSTSIFRTNWFSRPNGFQDYRISEKTGKYLQKKALKKSAIRIASYITLFLIPMFPFQLDGLAN